MDSTGLNPVTVQNARVNVHRFLPGVRLVPGSGRVSPASIEGSPLTDRIEGRSHCCCEAGFSVADLSVTAPDLEGSGTLPVSPGGFGAARWLPLV